MKEPSLEREPLEILADDFLESHRKGESPSIEQYAHKHPAWAEQIRSLFPTIAAMEGLKQGDNAASRLAASGAAIAQLEQLDDFRLIREIGRGGMGIVYEAQQLSLDRRVAVKLLPSQSHLTPRQLARFQREARTAANLHHSNIVPIFGVGEDAGYHYYVMQFIPGLGLDRVLTSLSAEKQQPSFVAQPDPLFDASTVARSLKTKPSEPFVDISVRRQQRSPKHAASQAAILQAIPEGAAYWRWVAEIGAQAAGALGYAHRQGTLHRDVKPANLLLDDHGTLWVADFGLAKAVQQEDVTRSGDLVGTLRYMAPEQLRGEADARSDVYGLGLTLYELATHQAAFAAAPGESLLRRVMESTPLAPEKVNPNVPRDLATIIQKAIAREPRDRYLDAAALADDLQRFSRAEPILARPIPAVERLWRWSRRNPGIAALSATVVALLLLVAAVAGTGVIQARRANRDLSGALDSVQSERQRSEATAELALETLDQVYERFAPRTAITSLANPSDGSLDDESNFVIRPALSAETASLLENLLTFYDRLALQGGDSVKLRQRRALANARIGEIRQRLGHYEQAETALVKAAGLYRQLADEQQMGGAERERVDLETARVFNQLGSVYHSNQAAEAARGAHLSALELLSPNVKRRATSRERRFQTARTYYLLGSEVAPDISNRLRPPLNEDRRPGPPARDVRPKAALHDETLHELHADPESLQNAITILDELVASDPQDPRSRHLLACCWRDLSPSLQREDHEAAREAVERSREILQQLVLEYPQSPDYSLALAATYGIRRPDDRPAPDEPSSKIEDDFLAARKLLTSLAERYPSEVAYAVALIQIEHKLAMYYGFQGRLEDAQPEFEQTLQRQTRLIDQFPNTPIYRAWKSAVQLDMADVLLAGGEQDTENDVAALIDSSIALLETALDEEPQSPPTQGNLARAWKTKAELCRSEGRNEDARLADEKARQYHRDRPGREREDFGNFPPPRDQDGRRPPRPNHSGERNGWDDLLDGPFDDHAPPDRHPPGRQPQHQPRGPHADGRPGPPGEGRPRER